MANAQPPKPQADLYKKQAAAAALDELLPHLRPEHLLGIGTGSTSNHFIDLLGERRPRCAGYVASSIDSARRLRSHDLRVRNLGAEPLQFYVDGCDESDESLRLIKGGGGAMSREKLLAGRSLCFICIADTSKLVRSLGAFPLPLEVLPMATAAICQSLRQLGANGRRRPGCITDNGLAIIDARGLDMSDPEALETRLSLLPGVLSCGIFARRRADILLLGGAAGVSRHRAPPLPNAPRYDL